MWMEDRNFIVAAGVEPVTLFKCHRSMLTKGSDILSGLFALPALSAAETYEGLPVVPLFDPWGDVRQFLKMLYGSAYASNLSIFSSRRLTNVAAKLSIRRPCSGHCRANPRPFAFGEEIHDGGFVRSAGNRP